MTHEQFNEHDANQGAQSRGEFLGMSGNSAWYLLGSAGASVMLVIVLWGMLGLSLLVCLALGAMLCALALVYVFALKNNRPEHYDSDFFESALIEAGLFGLSFGPSTKRPPNPFRAASVGTDSFSAGEAKRAVVTTRVSRPIANSVTPAATKESPSASNETREERDRKKEEAPMVPLAAYERLRHELSTAEEALEDAIASNEEESVCA